jgi:hypothetical protein
MTTIKESNDMTILTENQSDGQRGVVLRFPNHLEKGIFARVIRTQPATVLQFPRIERAVARLAIEKEKARLARQWSLRDRPKNRGAR